MTLNFFGRGAGFSDEHTSAYFTTGNELVVIDCPFSAYVKLKHMDLSNYEKLYFLITHTHADHIGALSLFIQYAFFALKKSVNVVVPNTSIVKNLSTLLTIEGVESSWYTLITANYIEYKEWFVDCISTKHVPQLECFGYQLNVDKKNVVYSGDTATIEPFLPYLTEGTEFYVDTSIQHSTVHPRLEDNLGMFLALNDSGVKVYLMHLDDASTAERIVANYPDIEVVTTVK